MKSHVLQRVAIALLVLPLLIPIRTATAWGPAGHKIIASIAFRRLVA